MTPFLQYVADDLKAKFGNDLSHVAVVFPGKRAGLFMNEYLAAETEVPVWSPRYVTISELFRSLSPLTPADPIETVCRIYELYIRLTGQTETLDFFYGWGERLLADFDDVDKNMADAARLFRNLHDIKELETKDYLTDEQEQVLRSFFKDFSTENNSQIRQNFLRLWNELLNIYRHLRQELFDEGMAYEGALYRNVVEGLEQGTITLDARITHYAFVGFNVLNRVEQSLLRHLQREGRALFYWDYDTFYVEAGRNFEAGVFMRENLKRFPGELPPECFDNLRHGKDIEFVSAATESIQAGSLTRWVEEHITADEKCTAIVLCNEGLLQPVLHAIPESIKEVNITKGFPLNHTDAYALVDAEPTEGRTAREWIAALPEKIKAAAAAVPADTPDPERTLRTEAYFQAYSIIGRFTRIMERGRLDVTAQTLHRLVRQVMRQASVPFNGEPAVGLQIMGVLETRCLDFDNILMLSVSEGNLPVRVTDTSFIPYALRREFGLTTPLHKTAVYAYYFYRLIQRAQHVRMIFNNSTDGVVKGERSRFMTQLLIEAGLPIRHFTLTSRQVPALRPLPVIPKPSDLAETLRSLSPSALNTYLRCPLQFYFQRVARFKEPDPAPEVIEANTFGNIFHKAAELFYQREGSRRGGLITADMLAPYLEAGGEVMLRALVRQAFQEEEVKENVVIIEVIMTYLQQLLRHDMGCAPFTILATEKKAALSLSVPLGDRTVSVTLGGIIDRIDRMVIEGEERLRIVDYKTGGRPERTPDLDRLFTPAKDHPHYILQTFLYALTEVVDSRWPIAPALFFVHHSAGEGYDPYIPFAGEAMLDFAPIAADFKERTERLIAEILDPKLPFTATPIVENCRSCPFVSLCKQ